MLLFIMSDFFFSFYGTAEVLLDALFVRFFMINFVDCVCLWICGLITQQHEHFGLKNLNPSFLVEMMTKWEMFNTFKVIFQFSFSEH